MLNNFGLTKVKFSYVPLANISVVNKTSLAFSGYYLYYKFENLKSVVVRVERTLEDTWSNCCLSACSSTN